MSLFERYLTPFVALAMLIGVVFGLFFQDLTQSIIQIEFANVNLPIAVCIWLMIFPMMLKIDFTSIKAVKQEPKGLYLTLALNWLIKPFTMALIATFFFKIVYQGFVADALADEYIAGMILLGVAPCTAMVFVWSHLTKGDANYTLVQVTVNDLIMIVAFAPIAAFLLDITSIVIPWDTLIFATLIYMVIPLIVAIILRHMILKLKGERAFNHLIATLSNIAPPALLFTLVLIFAIQADKIISNPVDIILIAIPLILQTYVIFIIGYGLAKKMKIAPNVAAPASLIATSNFFELAIAVAILLFGLNSGAVLATIVGVLVEVPVMLSLVSYINKDQARLQNA